MPLVRKIVSQPRLHRTVEQDLPLLPPELPPSLLRSGQPTVSLSAMTFPLSIAVYPSVVCFSQSQTISRTFHLPQIRLGKALLPSSHLQPRHPISLRPLPQVMPISRPSSRWQRQTKGVCPLRKTPAPSSSLEMYGLLPLSSSAY
jgi:hypothetical protein